MVLFEVPGWTVPGGPSSDSGSRKRKRPSSTPKKSSEKLQHAEMNIEKLMKTLEDKASPAASSSKRGQKAKKINGRQASKLETRKSSVANNEDREPIESKSKSKKRSMRESTSSAQAFGKDSQVMKDSQKPGKTQVTLARDAPRATGEGNDAEANLTTLQRKMKQSLDGARFRCDCALFRSGIELTGFHRRWLNETLYKSSSKDAEGLMKENPELFEEVCRKCYHIFIMQLSKVYQSIIQALDTR